MSVGCTLLKPVMTQPQASGSVGKLLAQLQLIRVALNRWMFQQLHVNSAHQLRGHVQRFMGK